MILSDACSDGDFDGSAVDQSPIYKSDLWPFISETPECCPWYLSVGIRLFQDSPGRFRGLWLSAPSLSDDDDDVSVFRLFRNP